MACSVLQSMSLICLLFPVFLCNSLLLWNPATGDVRQIPRTRTVKFAEWDCKVGFGFSAIVNDYKIVKAYAVCGDVISGVEVYSLSTSSWKEIGFGSLEGVRLFGDTTITANGSIVWKGEKRGVEEEGEDDDIDVIVSFDIAMQVFRLIPQPRLSENDELYVRLYLISISTDELNMFPISGCVHLPDVFNYVESVALVGNVSFEEP